MVVLAASVLTKSGKGAQEKPTTDPPRTRTTRTYHETCGDVCASATHRGDQTEEEVVLT